MASYLTSSTLISTVKREAMIPTTQNTFQTEDFLAIANQELRISVVPNILVYHEEYFTRDSNPVPLVANQSNYAIPYRAVGGKFRDVYYIDTNGNLQSMSRISPDDRTYYQQSNTQSSYVFFYLQGNELVLVPSVGSNPVGSLIFSYYMRPNELVDESRVATITHVAVGTSTTVVTVDGVPSGLDATVQDGASFTAFTIETKLDLLQTNPGHKTLSFDVYPTNVDSVGNTITFNNSDLLGFVGQNASSSAIPTLRAGDYIAFAGECIIPQIPSDLHDLLAQRVVARVLQSLGDQIGLQAANQKLMDMTQNAGTLINNRSEGQPQKIFARNSPLRSGKRWRRGWY